MPQNIFTLQSNTNKHEEKIQDEIEIILSLIVLAFIVFFSYSHIFLKPYLGFSYNQNNGAITYIDPVAENYLRPGDQILSVNDFPISEINDSVWLNPFVNAEAGEYIKIKFLRDGKLLNINYPKPSQDEHGGFSILRGDWILPYPFFAAGIITILFVRPRTRTRLLLIIFFYLYAALISAGLISNTGYWYSQTILRVVLWIIVPVSLDLHWQFPKPFKKMGSWIILSHYGIFFIIAILEALGKLPENLYLIGFIISIFSSLTILIVKFFQFKEFKKILMPLIFAYLLIILPLFARALLMLIGFSGPISNISLLSLTGLPGFYFFSAYRLHLNREIPYVNKAMKLYFITLIFEFLASLSAILFPKIPIYDTVINSLSFLIIIMVSLTGFGILLVIPALANDQIDLFKNESYTFKISANRAAGFVFFVLAMALIYILILAIFNDYTSAIANNIFSTTIITLVITGISILIYPKYQTFFDKAILGIQYPPEELIQKYAQQITKRLDKSTLAALIKNEILPSLLIREAILITFQKQSKPEFLLTTGVKAVNINETTLDSWIRRRPQYRRFDSIKSIFPWVHVVIPLEIGKEKIGLWCFGRKDPNSIYSPRFVKILEALAKQTTLALINIHQAELLQQLYHSNIERQEAELSTVARNLHDVILPSIGYLVELNTNDCTSQEFEEAIQRINNMIRNIMSGLRPATLDQGLNVALEELAEDPESQIGGKVNINIMLYMPQPEYYDHKVELHLYRMVQQSCWNALVHGKAKNIKINGSLLKNDIELHIEDDGVGFPVAEILDFSTLISNQHFGLANMYERAKIIHARLKIDSKPGQGTWIHIFWTAPQP